MITLRSGAMNSQPPIHGCIRQYLTPPQRLVNDLLLIPKLLIVSPGMSQTYANDFQSQPRTRPLVPFHMSLWLFSRFSPSVSASIPTGGCGSSVQSHLFTSRWGKVTLIQMVELLSPHIIQVFVTCGMLKSTGTGTKRR